MISRKEYNRLMRCAVACRKRSVTNRRHRLAVELLWKQLHSCLPKGAISGAVSDDVLSDWACVWEVAKHLSGRTPFTLRETNYIWAGVEVLSACYRYRIWRCGAPDYVLDLNRSVPDEVHNTFCARDELPERLDRTAPLLKAVQETEL